jgi:lysophospholipase L1-like esterase
MIRRTVVVLVAVVTVAAGVFGASPAGAASPILPPGDASRALSAGAASQSPLVASVVTPANASTSGYYLSLGDSLGYGYQKVKFDQFVQDPGLGAALFDTGYSNDLANLLTLTGRRLTLTNYSCPGETSTSMINGGCPWTSGGGPLHDPYSGPQLAAAVTFLAAHHGQVPLITLSIGANDVLPDLPNCLGAVASCPLPSHLATLHSNLATILATLHAAAPGSRIVVLSLYNPFAKAFPSSAALTLLLDGTIVATASVAGARVADSYFAFNVFPWPGLCALTYYCSNGDIHATDAGYRVIAESFFAASR